MTQEINQEVKQLVSEFVGIEWKTLGRLLAIEENYLAIIDQENIKIVEKSCSMITKWMQKNTNPTIETLKRALQKMNRMDIVRKLDEHTNHVSEAVDMDELNINNFKLEILDTVGKCGRFGKVYLCRDKNTNKKLAMKCIETGNIVNNAKLKKEVEDFEKEILLFQTLEHEQVVKYYGTTRDVASISILMEFMDGGSLHDLISNKGALGEKEASEKSYQILSGLAYLHSKNIAHRDIKGANILLDSNGNCKIADFGVSKQIETIRTQAGCKTTIGTAYWMSPEVINISNRESCGVVEYGKNADIWSFGCTVLEMLTTKPPWSHLEQLPAMFQIAQCETIPHLPVNSSIPCKIFVNDCFKRDPKLRPSSLQLLSYDWVKRNV